MTQQMPPSWVTQACPAVSLRTPPDWRVVPPPPMEYPPALIVAGPPRHGFAPNVTVTLDPLPPAMTLAEWHTINLESLRQALTSLRLLDLQPDEVDGAPALIRLCAYGMDDHPLSLIQWLVRRPDGGVTISATCHTGDYANAIDTLGQIARSCVVAQGEAHD